MCFCINKICYIEQNRNLDGLHILLHKFAVSHKNTQMYGLRRLWWAMYCYCCYRERCLKIIEKQKCKAVSKEWVPNYWIFNLTYSGGFLKLYYLLTFKHWRVHTKCYLYSFLLKVGKSDIDLWSQQMSPQKEYPLAGTSGFSFFLYFCSWHKTPDIWTYHLWSTSLFLQWPKSITETHQLSQISS